MIHSAASGSLNESDVSAREESPRDEIEGMYHAHLSRLELLLSARLINLKAMS